MSFFKFSGAAAVTAAALLLSGCSLTGLHADSDFSCPNTPGVPCRALSAVYTDSVTSPDVFESASDNTQVDGTPVRGEDGAAAVTGTVAAKPTKAVTGTPRRVPEMIIAIWIAPWTDEDGDFHEGELIHARARDARWAAARHRVDQAIMHPAVVQLPFNHAHDNAQAPRPTTVTPLSGNGS